MICFNLRDTLKTCCEKYIFLNASLDRFWPQHGLGRNVLLVSSSIPFKVILYKARSQLFLLGQYATDTFGPTLQSSKNWKLMKKLWTIKPAQISDSVLSNLSPSDLYKWLWSLLCVLLRRAAHRARYQVLYTLAHVRINGEVFCLPSVSYLAQPRLL